MKFRYSFQFVWNTVNLIDKTLVGVDSLAFVQPVERHNAIYFNLTGYLKQREDILCVNMHGDSKIILQIRSAFACLFLDTRSQCAGFAKTSRLSVNFKESVRQIVMIEDGLWNQNYEDFSIFGQFTLICQLSKLSFFEISQTLHPTNFYFWEEVQKQKFKCFHGPKLVESKVVVPKILVNLIF